MVRRIQIYMDDDLDEALAVESARTGRSKAALIRECVGAHFHPRSMASPDALDDLVGSIDSDPINDIDEVIYAG